MEGYVSIAPERYEQLVKAEHDANLMKALIADAYEEYHTIDRGVLTSLYTMFIGKKEDKDV